MERESENKISSKNDHGGNAAVAELASPAGASVHPILQLQHTVGNQVVQRLLRIGTIHSKTIAHGANDAEKRDPDMEAVEAIGVSREERWGRSGVPIAPLSDSTTLRNASVRVAPFLRCNIQIQRRPPETHVGSVGEGYQLQDVEGAPGNQPGKWHRPGEGGYSRLMQGAAGEMVKGMAGRGELSELMLRHVAADLSGLPDEKAKWKAYGLEAKKEMDSWSYGFAPGSIRDLYKQRYESCQAQIQTIDATGEELKSRTNQFNSFVPQGNAFYVSAARLSSMQSMLGATDNASLAAALVQGLKDAEDVMKRYRDKYEDGDRSRTTEKLDFPEGDETVEQAADAMTAASRNLDAKYMGFRTTVLAGSIGTIKQKYAKDEARLKEINEVKQFVRNVGKTVDLTMTVVRGAPTTATNVAQSARRGKASLNAIRNRRDILAGNRPRFNPTYVTSDKDGNMVVRNMQTGLDRNVVTGEKTPSPPSSIEIPSDISGLLGSIADFVYASEVKQINRQLEWMKAEIGAVKGIIDATETEQKIREYQNALNEFARVAADLQKRVKDRRREYREFGMQLDRFAQVDRETRQAGQGVASGAERYTTIMTMVAGVQEMLALGTKSQNAAPSGLVTWWQSVVKRRFSRPTAGEISTVRNIHQQIGGFRKRVSAAQEIFGSVASRARSTMGEY
jgi:hypothetical protein